MKRILKAYQAEADLTPMMDVVFILLIFFVATATFLKEQALPMTPPPQSSVISPSQSTIVVHLAENGLIRVNGVLSDIDAVRSRIEMHLASEPGQPVLVQASPSTKNRSVIRVVDQAYSAGASAVGFAIDQT